MNEFGELLREFFKGERSLEPETDRAALEESRRGFDRRMRTVRTMTWTAVAFMTGVMVWAGAGLLGDSLSGQRLAIRATLVLLALVAIGLQKLWLIVMQNQTAVMKELKRIQIRMIDLSERKDS